MHSSLLLWLALFTHSSFSYSLKVEAPSQNPEIEKQAQQEKSKQRHARKIFILGDSLTEGYGVAKDEAYPQILHQLLQKKYANKYQVIGAGVSGSTTASGYQRLRWIAKSKPYMVILALGANDGLRGFPVSATQAHLEKMLVFLRKENIIPVLAGMKVPPNYGKEYSREFDIMWTDLQKKHEVLFIPFLLEDVAGENEMNQEDGIHPNEKGHIKIAENIYEVLKVKL